MILVPEIDIYGSIRSDKKTCLKVCFPYCDPGDSRSAMMALRQSHELQL